MACFFGHKWDGCKCTKCGETRDEQHQFAPVPGECLKRCERCGKEIKHQWVEDGNGFRICTNCGKGEIQPVYFFSLEEKCCIPLAIKEYEKANDSVESAEYFGKTGSSYIDATLYINLIRAIEEAFGDQFPSMLMCTDRLKVIEEFDDAQQAYISFLAKGHALIKRLEIDTETESQEA